MKKVVLTGLFLLVAATTWAGFSDRIAEDLGERSAFLVAPVGQLWLIDIDATKQVQTGDLFVVIEKGAPVVHPVTKETIGNIEEVVGLLKVTNVKAGYSYAEVLRADKKLTPSMLLKRYSHLPAQFYDFTGEGEGVYTGLQGALPALEWESYAATQGRKPASPETLAATDQASLLFLLTDQGLAVKDHQLQSLRFYRTQELTATASAAAASSAPAAPGIRSGTATGTMMPQQKKGLLGGLIPGDLFGSGGASPSPGVVHQARMQQGGLLINRVNNKDGVWYGPRMEGSPVGVEVGDFDGDGSNDVALCFKDRLVIAKIVEGEFSPISEYSFRSRAMSLDGFDLDNDGKEELYVTQFEVSNVNATGFELQDGKLVKVIDNVPWFLRKIYMSESEGYALLGQELNTEVTPHDENDFIKPIFRVSRSGDKLQKAGVVSLPPRMSIYGFMPLENMGYSHIAYLDKENKLHVAGREGGKLWDSYETFGGSEVSFEMSDGTVGAGTRYVKVRQRLEPGPDGTMLIPVNQGEGIASFKQFTNSHLRAVTFDGYTMSERWRTKPQGAYLADYRMADPDNDDQNEIVMLVTFAHSGMLGTAKYGSSALLIYEMQ